MSTDGEARFSGDEVDAILNRAAELESAAPGGAAGDGLTLAQLEDIAVEVGLDPAHIRQAASEVRPSQSGLADSSGTALIPMRAAGGPLALPRTRRGIISLVRVIPRAITDDELNTILDLITDHTGMTGRASQVGSRTTWHGVSEHRLLDVSIVRKSDRTEVRIKDNLKPLRGGLYGGLIGGVGGGLGGGLGWLFAMMFGAAGILGWLGLTFGGSALGAHALVKHIETRRKQEIAELGAAIASAIPAELNGAAQLTAPPVAVATHSPPVVGSTDDAQQVEPSFEIERVEVDVEYAEET